MALFSKDVQDRVMGPLLFAATGGFAIAVIVFIMSYAG